MHGSFLWDSSSTKSSPIPKFPNHNHNSSTSSQFQTLILISSLIPNFPNLNPNFSSKSPTFPNPNLISSHFQRLTCHLPSASHRHHWKTRTLVMLQPLPLPDYKTMLPSPLHCCSRAPAIVISWNLRSSLAGMVSGPSLLYDCRSTQLTTSGSTTSLIDIHVNDPTGTHQHWWRSTGRFSDRAIS